MHNFSTQELISDTWLWQINADQTSFRAYSPWWAVDVTPETLNAQHAQLGDVVRHACLHTPPDRAVEAAAKRFNVAPAGWAGVKLTYTLELWENGLLPVHPAFMAHLLEHRAAIRLEVLAREKAAGAVKSAQPHARAVDAEKTLQLQSITDMDLSDVADVVRLKVRLVGVANEDKHQLPYVAAYYQMTVDVTHAMLEQSFPDWKKRYAVAEGMGLKEEELAAFVTRNGNLRKMNVLPQLPPLG